jgi:transcriptional regulator with XRE-family HTH domain
MDTNTPMYDFVMAQLRSRRVPQRKVAAESGVPFSTLTKIAQGLIKEPSVHSIQKLSDYFNGIEQKQAA